MWPTVVTNSVSIVRKGVCGTQELAKIAGEIIFKFLNPCNTSFMTIDNVERLHVKKEWSF